MNRKNLHRDADTREGFATGQVEPNSKMVGKGWTFKADGAFTTGAARCAGVLSRKKLARPRADAQAPSSGKWACVADQLSREGFLTGLSGEFAAVSQDFRESFQLRDE